MEPESTSSVFLPPEVLFNILSHVNEDRPRTFVACCLVSRLWYSVAVSFLYESPKITGWNFGRFAATICPEKRAYAQKGDLGHLVQRLDLSSLVHHSSNSLTARLLGRVKNGLRDFVAPVFSFSSMSLIPLSKCWKLRILDLSLVQECLDFEHLKKALRHMDELTTVRFPRTTLIRTPASHINWPPKLERIHFTGGGFAKEDIIPTFPWPESLRELTLTGCWQRTWNMLPVILDNNKNLTHLTLDDRARMPDEVKLKLPFHLHNVKSLCMPWYCMDIFLRSVTYLPSPLPLTSLEIIRFEDLNFPLSFLPALKGGLGNLQLLNLDVRNTWLTLEEEDDLDDALVDNYLRAGGQLSDIESGVADVGVFCVHRNWDE